MLWYHMCNSHRGPAVFGIRPTAVVVHLTELVLGAHTSRSNVLSLAVSEDYCRLEGTYCACKGVQVATVVLGFGSVNRILHGWSVQGRRGRRARLLDAQNAAELGNADAPGLFAFVGSSLGDQFAAAMHHSIHPKANRCLEWNAAGGTLRRRGRRGRPRATRRMQPSSPARTRPGCSALSMPALATSQLPQLYIAARTAATQVPAAKVMAGLLPVASFLVVALLDGQKLFRLRRIGSRSPCSRCWHFLCDNDKKQLNMDVSCRLLNLRACCFASGLHRPSSCAAHHFTVRILLIVMRHDDLLNLTGYAWGQDAMQALRQQVSRLKSMAARNAKDKVMAAQVRVHRNPPYK